MISETSEEVNANTNPPVSIDVNINKKYITPWEEDLLNGWGNWSLEDIVHILRSTRWSLYLNAAGYIWKIIFLKLLEAANNRNIPFEQIEEVVHTALHTNMGCLKNHIFHVTGFLQGYEAVCNFFKEFVKNGEKDAHYYNLIDEMLTYQTFRYDSFPLGYGVRSCSGWKEDVFDKLPSEMQAKLNGESFYTDGGDMCRALLSDASISM